MAEKLKTAGLLCFALIFSALVVAMVITSAQVLLS